LAEKRVALVIGNSAYVHVAKLPNPRNDAKDIAAVLRRLGFEVVEGIDLDKPGMERSIRKFSASLDGADVALFFYAGHGLQVNGQNYLAPVTARLDSEAALDFDMVSLNLVLRQMERAKRTNLVFLDACRDNPLLKDLARSMGATRSASLSRGLARVKTVVGTMISYATSPDQVALDGTGRNSPFTTALLKHIETPGLDIANMMITVRQDVLKLSNGKQIPWDHSSLTGRFYFKPGANQANPPDIKPNPNTGNTANPAIELSFWNSVKDSKNPQMLQAYLDRYPAGIFSGIAKIRIDALKGGKQVRLDPDNKPRPNGLITRSIHDCDRLAGHPADPDKMAPGLVMQKIAATRAIQACRQALDDAPDTARYMYQLGRAHLANYNITDGIVWLEKSANKGYVAAMYSLGGTYFGGRYGRRDDAKAFQWMSKAADAGFGYALIRMGRLYQNGRGTAKNAARALEYYRRAADKGLAAAMLALAQLYRKGVASPEGSVAKDMSQAIRWFERAADRGNAQAAVDFGQILENGTHIARDYRRAAALYRKAADKGHYGAMALIGLQYQLGKGVAKDVYEAARWYRKAADKGNRWAMNRLGLFYQNGTGVGRDYAQALRYYRKSADRGFIDAYNNIGVIYGRGLGVSQDYAEAARWYAKAQAKNHLTATYNLGWQYYNGKGVARDYAKAWDLFSNAAERNKADAMFYLGYMSAKGFGTTKSYSRAMSWYRRAADKGHAGSMTNIGFMYERAQGVPKNLKTAAQWYIKAANGGDANGMNNLGWFYNGGLGIGRNGTMAAKYFLKALKRGNANAKATFGRHLPKLTRATKLAVQRQLREAGVYNGAVDGSIGAGTKRALEAYVRLGR
jgi:TPR repeat protein